MKIAGLLAASFFVFLLGAYGGYVGANILGMATEGPPAAPALPDCSTDTSALEARKATLERELQAVEEQLVARFIAQERGPASYPGGVLGPRGIRSLLRATMAVPVEVVHCREYPCIAVVRAEPAAKSLEALRQAKIEPEVVAGDGAWAVVMPHQDTPAPGRTVPRTRALLRLLAAGDGSSD